MLKIKANKFNPICRPLIRLEDKCLKCSGLDQKQDDPSKCFYTRWFDLFHVMLII